MKAEIQFGVITPEDKIFLKVFNFFEPLVKVIRYVYLHLFLTGFGSVWILSLMQALCISFENNMCYADEIFGAINIFIFVLVSIFFFLVDIVLEKLERHKVSINRRPTYWGDDRDENSNWNREVRRVAEFRRTGTLNLEK